MAFVEIKHCDRCEKVTHHVNRKCTDCSEREYREKTAAWNALTTDEKLQDMRRRIEKLEQGPMRY